jgi:hypothetical protein
MPDYHIGCSGLIIQFLQRLRSVLRHLAWRPIKLSMPLPLPGLSQVRAKLSGHHIVLAHVVDAAGRTSTLHELVVTAWIFNVTYYRLCSVKCAHTGRGGASGETNVRTNIISQRPPLRDLGLQTPRYNLYLPAPQISCCEPSFARCTWVDPWFSAHVRNREIATCNYAPSFDLAPAIFGASSRAASGGDVRVGYR